MLGQEDLARAEAVFLGNSVRGLLRAHPPRRRRLRQVEAASVAAFLVYRPRDRQSGAVSWSGC